MTASPIPPAANIEALDALEALMEAWRQILAQGPADARAFERLVDATIELRDEDTVLPLLELACASLVGREQVAMTVRKAVWLAGHGSGDSAIELCRQVVDKSLSPWQLEAVVQIARDEGDDLLHRQALELLSMCGDAQASSQALELLGDFQYDRLGDRRAAASSWKAAAQTCGEADREHAQTLYERALETLPDDLGAAERLIDLYASIGAWVRLLDVLRLFIRNGNLGRAAEYLLRYQDSVIEAQAADEFLAVGDEIISQLGPEAPDWLGPLKRARSRVLLADPGRRTEACDALRELIESSGERDDVRAFELLVESNPSAEERHRERRWLYGWRAARAEDPTEVLLEWAHAELEYGDPEAARTAYEQVLALHPAHTRALDEVYHLRFQAGDFDGGVAALEKLREQAGDEGPALTLRVAEWLWRELGRPGEAAQVLAAVLADEPSRVSPRELGRKMLGDPTARPEVIERFEAIANRAPAAAARQILEFLVAAREETGDLHELRRRWLERIVELSANAPETALSHAIQGVLEAPDALALWDAAEAAARQLGRPELVAQAYHRVFLEHAIPPALAAVLGPRMVAFEEACSLDSAASVEALLRVLEAAPEARWALDRVKLALSAAARWSELLDLYDRAILAMPNDRERADLLSEAAFAARDLAGDPKRAVHYFEFLRALSPDDAAVDGALERLYEKLGLRRELAVLLTRRADGQAGFKLRELEQRIAELWLELGETANASVVVERMLANGADVGDVGHFLDRIARPPAPKSEEAHAAAMRAVKQLKAHYLRLRRTDDLARATEAELELAQNAEERAQCGREWLEVLLPAEGAPQTFEAVIERVEARVSDDPELAAALYKTLLLKALHVWRRGSTAEASADAQRGASRIVEAVATLLMQKSEHANAARFLHRSSRLPFPRPRRRELLCRAALCADIAGATKRAIEIFDELFDDDAADDVAAGAIARFAELLDSAGEHANLAARWQHQAQIRAEAGSAAAACDAWERSARLWEELNELDRAIAAYRQGAALASEASFQALARIHADREESKDAAHALEWLTVHARNAEPLCVALKLAEVYDKLGDVSRARACLEQVLPLAAEGDLGEQVRERLIASYRRDCVYKPLARLLAAEALRVDALPQKLALIREACELLQSKLGEPQEATSLLKLSVTWAPHDEGLKRWLLEALESLGRWDEAAAILREQVASFGGQRSKDQALARQRLARVLVRMNRTAEALRELRTAADVFPGQGSILYDLARVALDEGEVDFAEATYRALLFSLRGPTRDAETGAPHRADALLDLAEIALRKGDPNRGIELIDCAFDEAIGGDADVGRLEQALAARGRYDLLAREEERVAERAATLAQRALALGRWVELWEQHLGQSLETAVRIQQQRRRIARDLDHEALRDPAAWAALCRGQSVPCDADTRDRLALSLASAVTSITERADRNRLRASLARLLLQEPPRQAAAIDVLEGAIADDPSDREAAELLSDVLEREGRFDELALVLERCVQALEWEAHGPALTAIEWRLGQALEKAGRPRDAREAYESMLDRDTVDREIVAALTARLEELGSERLADCLERWMKLDAHAAPDAARKLFELRDRQGDRAGVARALEMAFSSDPANPEFRDRLALHYEQQGQWADAARTLRRALDVTPKHKGLFVRLADAYRRAGAHEELLSTLDASLAKRPRDAELLGLRAQAREETGDIDGAMADLELACSVDPKRLAVLLELLGRVVSRGAAAASDAHFLRMADILTRLNRPKEARSTLERLRARSPNDREVLRRIAEVAGAEQDWSAAADAYRALVLLPDDGESPDGALRLASALVDAYQRAGRVGEARGPLARPLDALARDPSFWPEVERLCDAIGDWERLARLQVRRAEQQTDDKERVALLMRAAGLWLEQGSNPASALPLIEQARSTAPGNVDVSLLWARTQVALGRPDEALAVLGDVVARNPIPRPLLAAAHLQRAKAHLSVDGLVEAWNALKLAFAADARDGEIATLLGLLSVDLEDEPTAESALTAVARMSSRVDARSKALAFYHLARMAHAKGDAAKARLLATKAIERDPNHKAAQTLFEKVTPHRLARDVRPR